MVTLKKKLFAAKSCCTLIQKIVPLNPNEILLLVLRNLTEVRKSSTKCRCKVFHRTLRKLCRTANIDLQTIRISLCIFDHQSFWGCPTSPLGPCASRGVVTRTLLLDTVRLPPYCFSHCSLCSALGCLRSCW